VAGLVSRELEAESVVVFDEAHNIDNVCIESFSVTLNRKLLDLSQKSVNVLGKVRLEKRTAAPCTPDPGFTAHTSVSVVSFSLSPSCVSRRTCVRASSPRSGSRI
jgi:hypothetical protein